VEAVIGTWFTTVAASHPWASMRHDDVSGELRSVAHAIVNAACDVLLGQVRRANGGLAYRGVAEFSRYLQELSVGGAPGVLGRQGHDFVRARYSWPRIEGDYVALAEGVMTSTGIEGPGLPCDSNQAIPS
jgi:hypothetical protein